MSSDVINALKRLERAGSDESRSTEKLCQAAELLAGHIVALLPSPESGDILGLPLGWWSDGYRLHRWEARGEIIVGPGAAPDRRAALCFAEAIGDGWLIDLAVWLERRTPEADGAAKPLRQAAEVLAAKPA